MPTDRKNIILRNPFASCGRQGKKAFLQFSLLLIGLLFLILGIWRDETLLILSKAIHVCLECVGIG